MTEDLKNRLMAAGLNKQQASSVTAETLVQLFMKEDSKLLINEARNQITEMQKMVQGLKSEYAALTKKFHDISEAINAISESQKEYGIITEEKAKTVVALYAAILAMNEKAGSDPDTSIKNAGYIVYAYLRGQAKREIIN